MEKSTWLNTYVIMFVCTTLLSFSISQVFEDDGNIASGATSVVHDVARGKLYLHGATLPFILILKLMKTYRTCCLAFGCM